LKNGADIRRRDKSGHTAVDYARDAKFDALAQQLQGHIDDKKAFLPF
jgi:hypothetical protein